MLYRAQDILIVSNIQINSALHSGKVQKITGIVENSKAIFLLGNYKHFEPKLFRTKTSSTLIKNRKLHSHN